MENQSVFAFVTLGYLLVLIGMGVVKASKIKSQEDFSLAGRGLPTFVLVGTLLATWIGTGSIFGNAQKTYENGLAVLLLPMASALGVALLYLLAERIRRFGQFTIQDILQRRYGAGARVLGTITLLLAYVIIVSYQYRAGSAVIVGIWPEMGETNAVYCVAFFVIAYTALAGMVSVAYTDVANGVLMVLGLGIAVPILFFKVGGMEGIEAYAPPAQLDVFNTFSVLELLSFTVPVLLLLLGDANMYQRFFSAKSPKEARRSAMYLFFGIIVLESAIILLAFLGTVMIQQGKMNAPDNPAYIIVRIAFEGLPVVLGSILVATVIAVVVSTADSFLLAPSTSFVRDVLGYRLSPEFMERHSVLLGRLVVVVLGLIALGLAFTSDDFFGIALFAYTIYGAGITPPLMAAFFWKRATGIGAACAMAAGVLTAIGWNFGIADAGMVTVYQDAGWPKLAEFCERAVSWNLDAVLPAMAVNIVVLVGVSLMTKPKASEQADF